MKTNDLSGKWIFSVSSLGAKFLYFTEWIAHSFNKRHLMRVFLESKLLSYRVTKSVTNILPFPVVSLKIAYVAALYAIIMVSFIPWQSAKAGVPVVQYQSFAGNIDFVATGGSLLNADGCTVNASGSATLGGIPVTATVSAAYLYWAGSGDGVSPASGFTVNFDGTSVTADRTFTESINVFGVRNFFSGFKDVTAQVAAKGNGTYTFSGLTVDTSGCGFIQMVVKGWGLFVIYQDAAEPNRVINVYDGLQVYQGSALTLTPSNFLVPNPPLPGSKHGILTWEGDVANSGSQNGFTEDLTFNGTQLIDALNPANNQFNATINVLGINNTYGVDLDVYSIDGLITAGDTSATSIYSSGQDVVVLNTEILSVSNAPVADLAITKSHVGNFTVGVNGVYTIGVSNNGPTDETGTITVTDTLPGGLSYVSATGTGWSCGAAGQDVTCTHPGPLANGASLPNITLTVSVSAAAVPSVTNTASVSGTLFDNQAANNNSSDPTTVNGSNLTTSSKTVVDINGGDVDAGDTLRYTVTLTETGGFDASGVSVTDNLPTNTTGINIVSFPAGATNNSTPTLVDISNITVAASTSETIVFDVTVSGSANPGDLIDNTATINNPSGLGATPTAPTLTVSPSLLVSGNKPLYIHTDGGPGRHTLSRILNSTNNDRERINTGDTETWTIDTNLQQDFIIDGSSGSIPIILALQRRNTNGNRTIQVRLHYDDGSGGGATSIGSASLTGLLNNQETNWTFNIPVGGDVTIPLGSRIMLDITLVAGPDIRVYEYDSNNGVRSRIDWLGRTVINVNSVQFYDAVYPGGNVVPGVASGQAAYVRAVISDPFGAADITSATIAMTAGPCTIGLATMTEIVALQTASTKTYESAIVNTAVASPSTCTASVTGYEGNEPPATQVTHTSSANLLVANPSLTILKSVSGTAKPGQTLTYNVVVNNSGSGYTNNVSLADIMSPYTAVGLTALPPSTAPFTFTDGAPCGTASGLTMNAPEYANDRPPTYAYVPATTGWDGAITAWRMQPMTGNMNPNSCFTLQYQAQVK